MQPTFQGFFSTKKDEGFYLKKSASTHSRDAKKIEKSMFLKKQRAQ